MSKLQRVHRPQPLSSSLKTKMSFFKRNVRTHSVSVCIHDQQAGAVPGQCWDKALNLQHHLHFIRLAPSESVYWFRMQRLHLTRLQWPAMRILGWVLVPSCLLPLQLHGRLQKPYPETLKDSNHSVLGTKNDLPFLNYCLNVKIQVSKYDNTLLVKRSFVTWNITVFPSIFHQHWF